MSESGTEAYSPLLGLSQREPPNNLQAEQALLGAILANNSAFNRVVAFLKPDHFYDPVHGRIYRECARLILRGQLVDAVTLKTVFEQGGHLDAVGGTAYLGQLLTAMVGIINAGEYGRAIHDAYLRRQLIAIGEDVVNHAFGADPEVDGEAQISRATDSLMELTSGAAKEAPEISIGDAARLAVHNAEALMRGDVTGILASGLQPVDDAVGGFWPGWLMLLGGRPGMGKTSLALQIAIGVARMLQREEEAAPPFSGAGGNVIFFCLEMSAEQMAGWALCQMAGVSNEILAGKQMTTAQAEAVLRAQRELDALPLRLVDAVGLSGAAIALRARSLHQRRRVRMVCVDHLQKLVSDQTVDRRNNGGETVTTTKATSAFKNASRQMGCPWLVLAQLTREVDRRDDPRPRLSDLMYGGEADADVVCFLFRKERYLKRQAPERFPKESDESLAKRRDAWHREWDEARGRAEFIVAKRRQGAETTVRLGFDGPTTSFYPLGVTGDDRADDFFSRDDLA